jgi:Putative DNA-binding domain
MNEALRQQGLLAALAANGADARVPGLRESGARAVRGLEAYRANAEASADRALARAFGTVQAMLGAEDFRHLAREFWRARPPQRGDLGEWGDEFPAWLGAHAALAAWPWLADCARLDLALHRNERAADATLDVASLARLESTDPSRLRVRLMPGTALLGSAWPIGRIHAAHQLTGDAAERMFGAVRDDIDAGRGEQVLVVRQGWRAVVRRLCPADAPWVRAVLDGACLTDALVCAGESFDFTAWLGTAVRESWLKEVVVIGD